MPKYGVQNVCDLGLGDRLGRIAEICQYYEDQGLDGLALVEVRTTKVLHVIRRLLPSLPYSLFKKGLIGPAGGLLTLSKDPIHPIDGVGYVSFSDNPLRFGRGFAKGAQPWQSNGVTGITVHPSCNPHANWELNGTFMRALRWQVEELTSLVARVENVSDEGLIVIGDTNFPPGSLLYERFKQDTGLVDPFDDEPTIRYRGKACRLDGVYYKGWGTCVVKTRHTFQGRTAPMHRLRGQTHFVSDHEGLILDLERETPAGS